MTSDSPNMAASRSLRLETMQAEANHAEAQRRVRELDAHYRAQEEAAIADFNRKLDVITAQFEQQRADLAAQVQHSLRVSIEGVLREKRDLEIGLLRRAHEEQASARRKDYEEERRRCDQELYKSITALITAGPELSPGCPPVPPSQPSETTKATEAAEARRPHVASDRVTSAETRPAPPAATEVPSQPQHVTSPPPNPTLVPRETYPIPPRTNPSDIAQIGSPQSFAVHTQATPTAPHQRQSNDEWEFRQPVFSARPPVTPAHPIAIAARAQAVLGHETPSPDPAISAHAQDTRPIPAKLAPKVDPTQKRKADGESNDHSPAPTPNRVKRTKLEDVRPADSSIIEHSPPPARQEASERVVSFDQVYGTPGKPAQYKHVIVQFPSATGDFYILRCDEHGVHFGEHPLRGAAKHLASAQHGFMSKAHATAIETLGHRVLGCTKELADRNNHDVLKAFKNGYRAFNANNLSQTKRAELGFPPLDPMSHQKATMLRKQPAGITNPVSCRFYVTGGELRCPVLILPWGDTSPVGLAGTLADTGIFSEVTEDGQPTGIPKPPKCYVYGEHAGVITGIRGWAKGYEDGGPLERKREFPVLCVEDADYRMWSVGWAKAAQLSALDFDDPSSRNIPFVKEAQLYFYNRVLRRHNTAPRQPAAVAMNASAEDVDMKDVGDVHANDHNRESDRDSNSRAVSDSDTGAGRADADSRRTSVSNREEHPDAKPSTAPPSAQLIAAQALNLQAPAPARSGFTAINSTSSADSSASRSARASLEPPSRAGSVPSAGGNHRRVFKIHARSSNKHPYQQPNASPSIVLPERPAEGAASPKGTPTQPQAEPRRPSPASLQNILQDFPTAAAGPPRFDSQSPKPASARRPLPSGPVRSGSPSRSALLSAVNAKLAQPLRDNRAGSAPVQLPPSSQLEADTRPSGSASAVPGLSRHATPQPPAAVTASEASTPAPEPIQRREQPPPPIQLPPPPTGFTPIRQLKTTPLATPTTSAPNTRANSPNLAQAKADTPTTAMFPKPETPILTPTTAPPAAFVPTMDVFDLAGFMDGSTEVFRSSTPGQYLRLIDDHQNGVLTTASDAPVAVRIEPKKIKTVERTAAQGGTACVVTIVYQGSEEAGAEGEPRTQTLVMEKARSTSSGMLNGVVHARRLCRRLQQWNEHIVCPSPGDDSKPVQWRFDSQTPAVTPAVTPGAVVSHVGEQELK